MIDETLATIFVEFIKYGFGGSVVGGVIWWWTRKKSGPSFSQSLAIGFLAGGAWGAIVGVFSSLMNRFD